MLRKTIPHPFRLELRLFDEIVWAPCSFCHRLFGEVWIDPQVSPRVNTILALTPCHTRPKPRTRLHNFSKAIAGSGARVGPWAGHLKERLEGRGCRV